MASIADRLINKLVGGVLNRSATNVASSAPIRNSRAKEFGNSDPFDKSNENEFSYGSLRYPLNVGTTEEYGHYMLFHIFCVRDVYASLFVSLYNFCGTQNVFFFFL